MKGRSWGGDLRRFRRDPSALLVEAAAGPEPVARLRVGGPAVLLKRPEDIGHVLMVNGANYEKTPRLTARRGRGVLGHGLFTASNADAGTMRRPVQGLYNARSVAGWEAEIRACADHAARRWEDAGEVELIGELERLERRVRARLLFGEDPPPAVTTMIERRRRAFSSGLMSLIPLWAHFTIDREGDRLLAEAIEERRREPREDLLSAIAATGIPSDQVRAEALMAAVAGFEAVPRGQAWTLWALAERPALADRVASGADPALVDAVVAESLRMRPPSPLTVRHAAARDELPSGALVRRGTKVLISPLILHHDPELFPEPARFAPERFGEIERKRRPRFHYLPFGAGSRGCIGRALALLETAVVTRVVAERFELQPAGPGPEPLAPAPPRPAAPVTVRLSGRPSAHRCAQRQDAAG